MRMICPLRIILLSNNTIRMGKLASIPFPFRFRKRGNIFKNCNAPESTRLRSRFPSILHAHDENAAIVIAPATPEGDDSCRPAWDFVPEQGYFFSAGHRGRRSNHYDEGCSRSLARYILSESLNPAVYLCAPSDSMSFRISLGSAQYTLFTSSGSRIPGVARHI